MEVYCIKNWFTIPPGTWGNIAFETTTPTPDTAPILTVFSKNVDGLTVTIDGQKSPEITQIRCNWGDGKQSTCSFDPDFKHTYTKPNTYEVFVYGFNKAGNQIAESDPISVSVGATDNEVESPLTSLTTPAVLAAIVTTIGGIVGALIALKKRGSSS